MIFIAESITVNHNPVFQPTCRRLNCRAGSSPVTIEKVVAALAEFLQWIFSRNSLIMNSWLIYMNYVVPQIAAMRLTLKTVDAVKLSGTNEVWSDRSRTYVLSGRPVRSGTKM